MIEHLVFLLEGETERDFLELLLPKVLPPEIESHFMVFEGKQDLEKNVVLKLKRWLRPNSQFIVMRDQDSGDCHTIKAGLRKKCEEAGHPDAIVRIACKALETFFIGDWKAVADAYDRPILISNQRKAKYRKPDLLGNPSDELDKALRGYQKREGARRITPCLDLQSNQSSSFNALIRSLHQVAAF